MKPGKIIAFYKKRWIYFTFSLTIMAIGLIMSLAKGVTLDIQFKGGAIITYNYSGSIDDKKAGQIARDDLKRLCTPQLTKDIASNQEKLVLNLAGEYGVDAADQKVFDADLKAAFPDSNLDLASSQMVEKFFGDKFLHNAIIAIILASVLILLYVWIRFKLMGGLAAGVTAVISLLHDLVIVFCTFVIFRIPIGDNFVAVSLSILGYSINDTIVIYDRIRENARTYIGYQVDQISDLSISQCIVRTINTNIAVMLSIGTVYVLAALNGLVSIQGFALPMAVGTLTGCYSTICIAGPLWVMWTKKRHGGILYIEDKAQKKNSNAKLYSAKGGKRY